MRDVLRRIAIHGGLTALFLGMLGFMFAELASIWLSGSPGVRMGTGEPIASTDTEGAVSSSLRSRVPFLMAVWGFVFIAIAELVVHWWRARREPPAAPPQPDEAEKLLEELLSQVESKAANPQEPNAAETQPTAHDRVQLPSQPEPTGR